MNMSWDVWRTIQNHLVVSQSIVLLITLLLRMYMKHEAYSSPYPYETSVCMKEVSTLATLDRYPHFSSTWETYLVSGTAGVSLWQAPSFWWDLHFQSQWNFVKCHVSSGRRSSLMVSALVSRFIGRVRALAGGIVLWIWARRFTLTVPLSTQVYKWVLANLMLGVTLRWTSIPSRGE